MWGTNTLFRTALIVYGGGVRVSSFLNYYHKGYRIQTVNSFYVLGPCAAGIVGHKSMRYIIFGESVKMASRMSRTGEGMYSVHL